MAPETVYQDWHLPKETSLCYQNESWSQITGIWPILAVVLLTSANCFEVKLIQGTPSQDAYILFQDVITESQMAIRRK